MRSDSGTPPKGGTPNGKSISTSNSNHQRRRAQEWRAYQGADFTDVLGAHAARVSVAASPQQAFI